MDTTTALEQLQSNNCDMGDVAAMMVLQAKDEVDFIKESEENIISNNNNNNNNNFVKFTKDIPVPKNQSPTIKVPKDRLSLFSFSKKSSSLSSPSTKTPLSAPIISDKSEKSLITNSFSCPSTPVPIGTPPRHKKFAKSSTLSRFLGNTYNAKKFDKDEKKLSEGKFNTFGGRRRSSGPYLERFKRYAKEEGDMANNTQPTSPTAATSTLIKSKSDDKSGADTLDRHLMALENFQERRNGDLSSKAMRTISRGLGKLWWRRTHSIDISTPDPEFKVSYLGNVLTGWAKGKF